MQAIVVAPNQEDRDFFNYTLRYAGLAVATTTALQPVTASLPARPVDLILVALEENLKTLSELENLRSVTSAPLVVVVDSLSENQYCALLDAGTDLVLSRSVSPRILTRYVQGLLRRAQAVPALMFPRLEVAGIVLDSATRTITVRGRKPQRLTQLEFRLFYLLASNPDQVLPTETIVERVWGYSGHGNRELVRGLIRRLRRKVESGHDHPHFIHNIPGVGYSFAFNPT